MAAEREIYAHDLTIDRSSGIDINLQIKGYFINGLMSGDLSEGLLVPSCRGMANFHGLSKNTVDAAYGWLRERGWLKLNASGRFITSRRENWEMDNRTEPVPESNDRYLRHACPTTVAAAGYRVVNCPPGGDPKGDIGRIVCTFIKRELGLNVSSSNISVRPMATDVFREIAGRLLADNWAIVVFPCHPSIIDALKASGTTVVPLVLKPGDRDIHPASVRVLAKMYPLCAMVIDLFHYRLMGGAFDRDTVRQVYELATAYDFLVVVHHRFRELDSASKLFGFMRPGAAMPPRVIYTCYLSDLIAPLDTSGVICADDRLIAYLDKDTVSREKGKDRHLLASISVFLGSRAYSLQIGKIKRSHELKKASLQQELADWPVPAFLAPMGIAFSLAPETDGLPLLRSTLEKKGIHPLYLGPFYPQGYLSSGDFLFCLGNLDELAIADTLDDLRKSMLATLPIDGPAGPSR